MTYRNTKFDALRVSLVCGVSAAALAFSVGTALAGDNSTPKVIDDAFGRQPLATTPAAGAVPAPSTSLASGSSYTVDATTLPVLSSLSGAAALLKAPGLSTAPTPYVLQDGNHNVIAAGTAGVLNGGTPISTLYSSETPGLTSTTAGTSGYYLVKSATGAIVDPADVPNTITAGTATAALPAGYAWANPNTQDPTKTYIWTQATFAQAPGYSSAVTTTAGSLGSSQTGTLLIDTKTGAFVIPVAGTNYVTGTGAASTGYRWVNPADVSGYTADKTAFTTYNQIVDGQSVTSQANAAGVTNTTTSAPGAVALSSSTGQYTAYGPAGTVIYDPAAPVTGSATGAAVAATTALTAGVTKLSSSQGEITLDATVDPLVTIKNAAALGSANSSFTQVHNGAIVSFEGTSRANPGLTGIDGGLVQVTTDGTSAHTTTIRGGAINTNNVTTTNLTVNPGGSVDLGDNVVHGVADPRIDTDAANKRYVDRGLDKAYQGTAIALALSQPIFAPGQSWAIRGGWGGFEGENAGGFTVAGIIGRDWFGGGTTVAIDGGVGFASDTLAGKAGVTIGFGSGYVPMK